MNPLAQALLNLAFSIAPRQNRVWLEDMRYEAAFIDNPLSWSLSALGLALRWRLAHIMATPTQMAFASVAMAAVAAILILPNMTNKVAPANSAAFPTPQSPTITAESPDSSSISRSAEAQDLPAENAESTTEMGFSEPLPPTLPTPATAPEGEVAEAVSPTLPAAIPEATDDDMAETATGSVTLGDTPLSEVPATAAASETATLDQEQVEQNSFGLVPTDTAENTATESDAESSDIEAMIEEALTQEKKDKASSLEVEVDSLEVNVSSVSLKITKEVTLEVYQGTSVNDELLFSGTTQTATLGYDLPIFIKASDGSAIELYISEDSSIRLDDGEIEKIIKLAQ